MLALNLSSRNTDHTNAYTFTFKDYFFIKSEHSKQVTPFPLEDLKNVWKNYL